MQCSKQPKYYLIIWTQKISKKVKKFLVSFLSLELRTSGFSSSGDSPCRRKQVYFSCDIVHANLDDHPNYTAMSYVWGPLNDGVPVLVGDHEFLMVTRNPMEVLYRFSGANTPTDNGNTTRLLWPDQLCINQYDNEERHKQVALMRRIYSQAQETRLWLGEEDEIATQAFELIRCFWVNSHDTVLPGHVRTSGPWCGGDSQQIFWGISSGGWAHPWQS